MGALTDSSTIKSVERCKQKGREIGRLEVYKEYCDDKTFRKFKFEHKCVNAMKQHQLRSRDSEPDV